MDGQIRAFFALPLSAELTERIGAWMKSLRRMAPGVRWVAPQGLHVTLRFLGDISFAQVHTLSGRVGELIRKEAIGPLNLMLGDTGAFPHLREPRTFWLGVEGNVGGLSRLAELVEQAVREEGFEAEPRPFRAHITLGRVRTPTESSVAVMQALGNNPVEGEGWTADSFVLMKSDLRPEGAFYTPLASFRL